MRRLILEEPVSRAAVWSRRAAVFALATAGVAIALSRFGGVEPAAALTVFGAALIAGFSRPPSGGRRGGGHLAHRPARRRSGRARRGAVAGSSGRSRLSRHRGAAAAGHRRRDDRSRFAALVHDLGQSAPSARRPYAAALERRDRRAAEGRLSRSAADSGRSRSRSGLSARAARRQGSRLARRRRQPAQSARRRRRANRGRRIVRCCSASSTTSPSASARSPARRASTSVRSRASASTISASMRAASIASPRRFRNRCRSGSAHARRNRAESAGAPSLTTSPRATKSSRWASVDRLAAPTRAGLRPA